MYVPATLLVVTELSRITRSQIHLLETAQLLEQRQVNLVSLRENIDTSTATGRCFLSMVAPSTRWNGNSAPRAPPAAGHPQSRGGRPEGGHEPM
jgi:hypothetical protein